MSDLDYNSTHEDQIEARLTTTNHKANVTAIVRAFAAEIQLLEDAAYQVLTETGIETGVGAQLDKIGKLLVLPRRAGWTDAIYRSFLKARVRVLRSFGRAEDIIDVARIILGSDDLSFYDWGPAYYEVQKLDADPDTILAAGEFIDAAGAVAIGNGFLYSINSGSSVIWGSTVGSVPTAKGFGDSVSGLGNTWGGAI